MMRLGLEHRKEIEVVLILQMGPAPNKNVWPCLSSVLLRLLGW